MSNVNPGDFARVIDYPKLQDFVGMSVYVKRSAVPKKEEFQMFLLMSALGHVWECEILESRMDKRSSRWMTPGRSIWVVDRALQRLDPPSDENLWSTEPLPHEERKP